MVTVNLGAAPSRLTGGTREVSLDAGSGRDVLQQLRTQFPGLAPILDNEVSLVVNGSVTPDLLAPLPPDAEVYLLQKMRGG